MFGRLLGAVIALAFVTPATAQQGPFKGGPYAGLTAGYSSTVFEAEDVDLGAHGLFGGAYAGFGFYTGGVYLGLEGDAMLTDIKAKFSEADVTVTSKSDYLASIRARVGLPLGPALAYVTAGPAFTNTKITGSDGIDGASKSETLIGVAVGGGLETNLTNTIMVRIEGLHYAFPDEGFKFGDLGKADIGQQETVIRVGVGFRLN